MSRKTAAVAAPEKEHLFIGRTIRDIGWRWGLLFLAVALFAAALVQSVATHTESDAFSCMGVPILSDEEVGTLGSYRYRDYSEHLKFQDEFAAVDVEHSVIYIPQKIDADTVVEDLRGLLTVDRPGCKLYFASDVHWDGLKTAVADNHKFQLLVSAPNKTYMQYDVVFTTLPVMSIHGQVLYKEDILSSQDVVENVREVMTGRMVLWDPENTESGVQASRLHWNIRGSSSKYEPKNAWKLTLKDWNGDNTNEELLQLGSDDDWILNSMNMEDSNIREKLFIDLWNELSDEVSYHYPMSTGKYVEVLINSEYYGLCMLQRRVDDKYLELKDDTVLVKAKLDGEELVYEYFPENTGYPSLGAQKAFFTDLDCSAVVRENFVDVSLFLQLFAATDNCDYKNMYYIFSRETGEDTITLLPWDTDMSLGLIWSNEKPGFSYNYEQTLQINVQRRELQTMRELYPQLDDLMRTRWTELRQGIFSLEHITEKMNTYLTQLDASGAPERDVETWGLFYDGADTIPNLYRFVEERLAFLDEYYTEK